MHEPLSQELARILKEAPPTGDVTMNALLIALMAFLLALPLPSAPFFPTNGLPAYTIIVIAASMLEEDGVLIFFGYALALATVVFFASIAGTVVGVWGSAYHFVRDFFATP